MKGQLKPITILGAGAFGTALGLYLAKLGQTVRIWSIEKSEIDAMLAEKTNRRYLPGFNLPETLQPVADLDASLDQVEDVLIAVPSIGYRHTLTLLQSHSHQTMRLISVTKGLDEGSGALLNNVIEEILGKDFPYAVLSGPSFAKEVARGLPTAVVLASHHQNVINTLIKRFDSPLFRVFPSQDVIGVELGGVVKNVIAIATGISDGMQQGANARSALITNGLAEISRLGLALGAKLETFMGLSGMGDLILTCLDDQSRNRRFGLALGKGRGVDEAEHEIGHAVEGKRNAKLVLHLANQHHIHMPICAAVWKVIQGELGTDEALREMLI